MRVFEMNEIMGEIIYARLKDVKANYKAAQQKIKQAYTVIDKQNRQAMTWIKEALVPARG